MVDEAPAIGIDLGTTNTCAAVLINDEIKLIHGDDGLNTTASFVFFENSGERLVGNLAKDEAYRNPKNGIFGVKRFIGRSYDEFKNEKALSAFPYVVDNENNAPVVVVKWKDKSKKDEEKEIIMKYSSEEISAMILMKIKERAEEILGKNVTKAVITVPAHFNGTQRQATIDAAKIAGLKVLRVINEPTAAILAYDLQRTQREKKRNVLVYDFGGGTFDVTIATVCNQDIKVVACNGEPFLGGDDLNNNLVDYFIKHFQMENNTSIDLKSNLKFLDRLRQQAEITKKILSVNSDREVIIDCIDGNVNDFECIITRSSFQSINEELFNKTLICLKKTLEDAKMNNEDIDEILLVGGSTRIPYVKKLVRDYFGKEPNASIHPDEAVAIGAARQAAMLSGLKYSKEVIGINLTDVCSLSLGIGKRGNIMSVIIPRNTKIPTKNTRRYQTTEDNQTVFKIGVYEGERAMVTDNKLLVEFHLTNIRKAPAGEVKHDVTFEIDESGILTATSKEVSPDKNNTSEIVVSIYKNNLSEEQIKEMIENAEKYKKQDEEKKAVAILKNNLDEKCTEFEKKALNLLPVSVEDKRLILNICKETRDWLHSDSNFNKSILEKKLKEIDQKCLEILNKI